MNYRLLIIDDDPRSVKQLRREVRPLRHEVASVNDQESAYRLLEHQSFGYATIRYLRKHYPYMQIVAVTAYDDKR